MENGWLDVLVRVGLVVLAGLLLIIRAEEG